MDDDRNEWETDGAGGVRKSSGRKQWSLSDRCSMKSGCDGVRDVRTQEKDRGLSVPRVVYIQVAASVNA